MQGISRTWRHRRRSARGACMASPADLIVDAGAERVYTAGETRVAALAGLDLEVRQASSSPRGPSAREVDAAQYPPDSSGRPGASRRQVDLARSGTARADTTATDRHRLPSVQPAAPLPRHRERRVPLLFAGSPSARLRRASAIGSARDESAPSHRPIARAVMRAPRSRAITEPASSPTSPQAISTPPAAARCRRPRGLHAKVRRSSSSRTRTPSPRTPSVIRMRDGVAA
jgi:hypothetical protein